MGNLAAGLYDASDNLVASWDTLVTEYGMDIGADQSGSIGSNAPATVLSKSALSTGVKLVISNSATRIGANAFAMLDTLTSIVIPNSVTSIGDSAFTDCMNLVSINIPVGITAIGYGTFFDCVRLTSINIPVGVTSIGDRAFCLCDALADVYYGGTAEQWSAIAIGAENTKLTGAIIHYAKEGCKLKGTWRFNDVLTEPDAFGELELHFTCSPVFEANQSEMTVALVDGVVPFDRIVFFFGDSSFSLWYKDTTAGGGATPMYNSDETLWNAMADFVADVGFANGDILNGYGQTITFTEEQEVSDKFYTWFTANAVEVVEATPVATITYKGETLETLNGGEYVLLHTKGQRMEDDIRIDAFGGGTGGECSGNHIIEVTELPTENIDESAVYLCGGSYYKYAKEFTDVIIADSGETMSYKEFAPTQGLAVSFNTIPTKTTDGILETELGASFNFYYIEDEAGVFIYINPWMPMTDMGLTNGGVIANISEATTDGCYYALFESNWKTYICPVGPIAITDRGVYDVTDFASASVVIEDAAICGVWKFNDTIDAKSFPIVLGMGRQAVNFSTTVNGTTTNWVYMGNGSGSYSSHLYYSDEATPAGETSVYSGSWHDEEYKTVDFGAEPQMVYSEFKEWLESNATRIEESGSSECDGNHIIEVDALPTTGIDENALYSLKPQFTDLVLSDGANLQLLSQMLDSMELGFYTIPTKTTDGILVSDLQTTSYLYCIEDEDNVFMYTADGWVEAASLLGTTYNGKIYDVAEAYATPGLYALFTQDKAYYKYVKEFAIYANMGGQLVEGVYINIAFGVASSCNVIPTKTTDGILETVKDVSEHYYYIEDEGGVFTYTGGQWVAYNAIVVSNLSEATTNMKTYALVNFGWVKYLAPILAGKDLIEFTIDGKGYIAERNMPWLKWCESEYNNGGYTVNRNGVVCSGTSNSLYLNSTVQHCTDTIEYGHSYVLGDYVSG